MRSALAPFLSVETPSLLFLSAVTVTAWYGGVRPGLLATVLALLAADFFFVPPLHELGPIDRKQVILFALFLAEGSLISWLAGRLRSALRDSELSEAQFRAILDTARDAIVTIDERGIVQSWNPAAERMFGYDAAEVIGRNVKLLMPSPYCDEHDGYLTRYLQTGETHIIGNTREVAAQRKNGTVFPVDLNVGAMDHRNLFTAMIRDITERKHLEHEVVEIATLEQQRIGQDLHDECGQQLLALGLLADSLAGNTPADVEVAHKIGKGLRRVLRQVRNISRGLALAEVDPAGLRAALAEQASRLSETSGVRCVFRGDEAVRIENSFQATHLYHIAQEACTNAFKHARGRNVEVRLRSTDDGVVLEVQDDGGGIPPSAPEGLGLRIMRNRASVIGAALTIEPTKPHGTVVTCRLRKKAVHVSEQAPETGSEGADRR